MFQSTPFEKQYEETAVAGSGYVHVLKQSTFRKQCTAAENCKSESSGFSVVVCYIKVAAGK